MYYCFKLYLILFTQYLGEKGKYWLFEKIQSILGELFNVLLRYTEDNSKYLNL